MNVRDIKDIRDPVLVCFKEFMRENGVGSTWDGLFLNIWWFEEGNFNEVFARVCGGCLQLGYLVGSNRIVRFDLCDPSCFELALNWVNDQVDKGTPLSFDEYDR